MQRINEGRSVVSRAGVARRLFLKVLALFGAAAAVPVQAARPALIKGAVVDTFQRLRNNQPRPLFSLFLTHRLLNSALSLSCCVLG